MTRVKSYHIKIRKALLLALEHDVVNTAKAAAYSGMLMLFPAVLVITTLVAQVKEGPTLVGETRSVLEQFLPADTFDLVQSSILNHQLHSGQVVLSATGLSLFAGLGVMLSLMEGFRRAYRLPPEGWSFWGRRGRALLLVPIVLVPLALASLVVAFGHQIELWMIDNAGHELRHIVIFFWRMVRWTITFVAILAVLTALYHFGTKRTEHWLWVLPGAIACTLIWFPATLAYGWYVTTPGRLFQNLRIVCGRHRHAGLALYHLLQRAGRRGAERGSLLGSPESNDGADLSAGFSKSLQLIDSLLAGARFVSPGAEEFCRKKAPRLPKPSHASEPCRV